MLIWSAGAGSSAACVCWLPHVVVLWQLWCTSLAVARALKVPSARTRNPSLGQTMLLACHARLCNVPSTSWHTAYQTFSFNDMATDCIMLLAMCVQSFVDVECAEDCSSSINS